MPEEPGHKEEAGQDESPAASLWRMWMDNPLTRSWLEWQKVLWASHPMSRLVPLDVEEIWRALVQVGDDLAARPAALQERTADLLRRYNELWLWTARRGLGEQAPEQVPPSHQDRRFQDEVWASNLVFSVVKQAYLVMSQWMLATVSQMQAVDPKTHQQVNFYIRQFVDALSPANFVLTNPVVLRETLQTGGENLRRGLHNILDDLQRGEIKVAGREQFKIGRDLALSPGQVVFRNDLIELIQYAPATQQVWEAPILFIPPWINKYYILDIRPNKSMVEYLVQQGFSVFLISWRNPDASMENIGMEDYVRLGPLEAMRVAQAISGAPRLNLVGYCIGGTLLSIALAVLAAQDGQAVNSGTFFTSLQDFSEVGETAVFVSEEWVAEIERRMASKGYLDSIEMGSVFRLLRSNDLIWTFVVNNYLLGKEPLPFDLMYWSVDGTRMPRAMHSYYLRNMYLENNLVKPGHLTILGQPVDLGQVRCPCYIVSGTEDHIVPWPSAFKAQALFSGPARFVLGYGGHIASIINPPAKAKGFYLTNETGPAGHERWLKTATRHEGSWWGDWVAWLGALSGPRVPPPPMGNADYPPLVAAPGTYVTQE